MPDPLIREVDNYVVLEPGKEEKFLSAKETLQWIFHWLSVLDELPSDLKEKSSLQIAAQHLLDTSCDLQIKKGFTIQWFAIRLDRQN